VYFIVTSKMRSTSTRSLAIAPSLAATPSSSPLITPAAEPSPSAERQFTAQPAASNTLVVGPSASPVDKPTGSPLPADNSTSAGVGSPSATTPTIVTQPAESTYQTNKSPPSADEESVRQFVRDYYAELSRRNLDAIVSRYSDAVDYQGQGHHDRKYIRTDMANYFRRWDKIVFDGGDISVSRNGDNSFAVSFNFPFVVAKGLSPEKRGFSSQVWVLREGPPGKLQIVSQSEKVIAGTSRQRKSHR
jgi:ketosteroid isomerase-like protein